VEEVTDKVTDGLVQVISPPVVVIPAGAFLSCATDVVAEAVHPLIGFVTTTV
jgi:hypothetical protein